jgi:uncharacterized coiled-coil DUF342 family protein
MSTTDLENKVEELEQQVGNLEDELTELHENYTEVVQERDRLKEKVETALDEANELIRGLDR